MYLEVDTNTFNQSLIIRDSRECATGQLWYVCNANDFRGCCSVDACSVPTCPDTNTAAVDASSFSYPSSTTPLKASTSTSTSSSSSSTSSSSPTPATTTTTTPSTTPAPSPITSSQTTTSLQTTSQALSPTTLLITTTINNPLSTTSSPSTSPSGLSQKSVPNPSNSTPIIAGAIVGGIIIMCLTMAVFCGFRFRQKKKQAREKMFAEPESPDAETIQFYSTNGKMLQSRTKKMSKSSGSGGGGRGGKLVLGDGLAPFGGRKSNSSTDEASSPGPSATAPAITQSQISAPVHPAHLKQSIHAVHPSPTLESSEDYESDRPLAPDPEKSSLTPPPESSHPAFHPLPGMASTRPAYRPGMNFTINELDGREVDHVPFANAGGRGSGFSGGRSEGTGSDGAVSAMSTPSQPTSNGNGNISEMSSPSFPRSQSVPQTQANWHANPSILLPGQPTPIQSQYQYQPYHRRGNSQSNNGSAGSFSSLPQQTYAQTQYLKQQAQIQYHNQVAQSRRMHANVAQNPHQMYTESKEHQQNMGYQNALLLAQELEHERVQAQAQARVTLPYTNSEVTHEQNTGISHQETTYQSAPIEIGINARSQAQHSQIPRSPLAPVPSTSTAISQTQLRALHSPQQREQQQHEENTRMQVQANLYGGSQMLSNTYSEVPASSGDPNFSKTNYVNGNGNQSFQYRVVAPTPPPTMQNPQNPQTETQTQTQNTNLVTKDAPQHPRTQDHILSWAEYDGGRDLGFSSGMNGKGKGKDVVG